MAMKDVDKYVFTYGNTNSNSQLHTEPSYLSI
jgi:hypothetical protein